MSLFSQTARYLLLTAFFIALIGSVGFYTLIHRKIRHEVDEILVSQLIRPKFSDIMILDSLDGHKRMPVRQFVTTANANGQRYLIRVQQPYDEFNELAHDLSIWIIIGFSGLMTLSVLVGLGLSSRLWRPFYTTINQLRQFRLDQPTSPAFPQAHVREFDLLSRSLGELTRKLRQQFSLRKQFSENASHELQTPLAVASVELDFLLQSQHLTEDDHIHLQRATDALSRLNQLNRSLLLLTQVENDQFTADELVNLSAFIDQYIHDYEPFFAHKHFVVTLAIQPDVTFKINRQLAGVLITNLLKNTVRHCPVGGQVALSLTNSQLTILNSGELLPFAESQLFNRFVKDPSRPDSIGLGLALVKQICDRYEQVNKEHSFQIGFVSAQADYFKFAS